MEFRDKCQSNDALKDAILRQFDEQALAYYISQRKGQDVKRFGSHFGIGAPKYSIRTKTIDGVAKATEFNGEEFEGGYKSGNIFDWVGRLEPNATEYRQKLIICAEIAGQAATGEGIDSAFTDAERQERKKETEPFEAARRKDYEKFKSKTIPLLIEGLNSRNFETVCKNRHFDPSKIATLRNIGFCVDETTVYLDNIKRVEPNRKHLTIRANSLVVWNDDDASFKALERDLETGDRLSEIQLPGANCEWMPFDDETIAKADRLYFTEGETSAIALIFAMIDNAPACAFPCKPTANNFKRIRKWAKTKEIILAYDNDDSGRGRTKTALTLAPNAIDISQLWSGDDWKPGDDPNNFTMRCLSKNPPVSPGEKISLIIEELKKPKEQAESEHEESAEVGTAETIDVNDVEELKKHFLKKAENNDSVFAKVAMNDPVVGGFVELVDPFRMRSHAPIACMIAYAVACLSQYIFGLYTQARIINIVSPSGNGKDWINGTDKGHVSKGLMYQLNKLPFIDADFNADASITGNGMSKSAFLYAANPENVGKVLVMFRPEFGNAQTRGYGQAERAGSIGAYDIALDYGVIKKPQNKADLKELKDYENEYEFNAVEVRSFQDINGAKVVAPRFRGSGEARREFWFYMASPEDDKSLFNIRNSHKADNFLKKYAFIPEETEKAYDLLRKNILPPPKHASFDSDTSCTESKITIDSESQEYENAFLGLLDVVTNTYYLERNGFLLKDKLKYCTALSAGMHGRTTAAPIDYQIGAYFTECLCDSLDKILEASGTVDDPDSEREQIIQRVREHGIRGVLKKNLSHNQKLLNELSGMGQTKDGLFVRIEPDAPLVSCTINKAKAYIAREFLDEAKKNQRFTKDGRPIEIKFDE